MEQTVTGSVGEVKGAAHRGGQKIKAAHQKKRANIKERESAQVPHEPETQQPTAPDRPAIRERPRQAQQGRQTEPPPRVKAQAPQAAPRSRPKATQRTVKERKADIPQRPAEPKAVDPLLRARAEAPAPPAKGTAPVSQSEAAAPRPEIYQGKMRQAAAQKHREQTIRQKMDTHPEPPAERPAAVPASSQPGEPPTRQAPGSEPPPPTAKQATVGRPTPPPEKQAPVGRAAPPPARQASTDKAIPTPTPSATEAAPTQPGGSRFAVREKVKNAAPKEKPSHGMAAIKTRQQTDRLGGKTAAKPIKTAKQPGKKAAKAAQKRMKQYSQRKLTQQMRKATKAAIKTVGKAIVAAAKAVAAAISAIAGVVGGGVLLVALYVIFLVAAVVASPFGIFFAGQDPPPDAVTPREVVAEVNAEYDAKIENLKAGSYDRIEMAGAPADWRDVLTVFAVKTAGSDDGVDVVTLDADRIARMKAVYWDMTEIETRVEVIEHSDGEGGSWTERVLYITVTGQMAEAAANAYGFTRDQRSQLVELQAPENNDLWLSLLYGISGDSGAGRDIVSVALSQIGNVGGQPYWSWYGFGSREEWCACFVSWCANECGYIDNGTIPKFAGCGQGSQWFKSRGQWAQGNIEPVPGMIIFFDWDDEGGQDGAPDHVGIVERVENGTVYTVEGNSGDACRERHYTVGHYEIFGYGIPNY